jgi:hypothetical protein
MKRILFILLLLTSLASLGQMRVMRGNSCLHRPGVGAPQIRFRSLIDTNTSSSGTTYASFNSIQAGQDELILACSVSSLASGATPTNWTSGMGMSWVEIVNTNYNAAGARLTVWRGMTNNNSASATLGPMYAATRTGNSMYVCGLSNVVTSGTSGAGAIVQFTVHTNATANPSATLSALGGSGRNAVIVFVANVDSNGAATSPETGWTEDRDNGYSTPSTGLSVIHRLATTDNTVAVTQAAQQWAMICIEIAAVAVP